MKRLFILRHAKSTVADPAVDDFDRSLAPRGRRAAPLMARYMRDRDYCPDVALCSLAVRACETWAYVRAELGCSPVEDFRRDLYLAEPRALLETIRGLSDRYSSALIIGHNPGIQTLALGLLGHGSASVDPFGKYPTGALAVFDFDAPSWTDIAPGRGKLVDFKRPKDIDQAA